LTILPQCILSHFYKVDFTRRYVKMDIDEACIGFQELDKLDPSLE